MKKNTKELKRRSKARRNIERELEWQGGQNRRSIVMANCLEQKGSCWLP